MMNVKTELSKEQFKDFYSFLNIIKKDFNDLGIVNGHFRARSNDKTCIVETDFGYIRNIDFSIADIISLVNTLSSLDKKTAVTITIDDKSVIFADGYQSGKVSKAVPERIDNKYMPDKEMNELFLIKVASAKPFIKETLPKAVVSIINKRTRELHSKYVSVKHVEGDLNKGYLSIFHNSTWGTSKTNKTEYTINLKETFLTPIEKDHYFNVSILPFMFNKADIVLNYYIHEDEEIIFTIYNTSVGELPVTIYARAMFIEDDE